MFGSGRGGVICGVGELIYDDEGYVMENGERGEVWKKLYEGISGMEKGREGEMLGWRVEVEWVVKEG